MRSTDRHCSLTNTKCQTRSIQDQSHVHCLQHSTATIRLLKHTVRRGL